MGQVETKTILIGGTADGLSGEMYELTARTYLNQDRTEAVTDGGFWLLGNAGDQIPVEDAVRFGLVDGDAVSKPKLDLDARTIAVDEILRRSTDLDRREAQLAAQMAQFAKDRAAVAIAENAGEAQADGPGSAPAGIVEAGVPETGTEGSAGDTGGVSPATGDTEGTEEAPAPAEDAGGSKEAAKTADKAVEKPKTK